MKKVYFTLAAMFLFAGIVMAQPKNLVLNGGAEGDSLNTKGKFGWFVYGNSAGISYSRDGSDYHSGLYSVSVTVSDFVPPTVDYHDQLVYEKVVGFAADSFYRYSIWAKGANDGDSVNFTAQSTDLGDLDNKIYHQKLTADWKQYIFVFNTENFNNGAKDTVRLPIHLMSNDIYWFDDLSVVKSSLAGANVNLTGDTIYLEFGSSLTKVPAAFDLTSFVVKVNNTVVDLSAVHQDTVLDSRRLGLVVSNKIKNGQSVTVDYTAGTAKLSYTSKFCISTSVVDFAGEYVENLASPTGVPTLTSKTSNLIVANPVANELQLTSIDNVSRIEITNVVGQKVNLISRPSSNLIDVSGLKNGVYLISVFSNGSVRSAKFVKQ